MAAKENQGLQIALIVLVMLTVILLATTYFAFSSYQKAEARAQENATQASDANNGLRDATNDRDELKATIGVSLDSDGIEAARTQFQQHLAQWGAGLPEEKQSYTGLMETLGSALNDANTLLVEEKDRLAQLQRDYQQLQATTAQKLQENQDLLDQYATDVKNLQTALEEQKGQIDADKEQLLSQVATLKEQMEQAVSEQRQQYDNLQAQHQDLQTRYEVFREQSEQGKPDNFEVADGRITRVSARGGTVSINVGSRDALPRQATFSVYGRDAEQVAQAERKGAIEVVRITGPHSAEARITDETLTNPILTGDKIFSPAWHPGRREHFAVTGFIDIDSDGRSDLDTMLSLIRLNGGTVDAYIDAQGNSPAGFGPDNMSVHTRYIVEGTPPQVESENPRELQRVQSFVTANTEMLRAARGLGVKRISLDEFLDYIGYQGDERTVEFGQPRGPSAPGFQRRNPPAASPGTSRYYRF